MVIILPHPPTICLSCGPAETILALRAPSGTTLEVPDPDEGLAAGQRRFQIFLRSQDGPVDVYMISADGRSNDTLDVQPNPV